MTTIQREFLKRRTKYYMDNPGAGPVIDKTKARQWAHADWNWLKLQIKEALISHLETNL